MRFTWRQHAEEERARLEADKKTLREVKRRWPEVHRAARSMDDLRVRNGFAEMIRDAMGVTR